MQGDTGRYTAMHMYTTCYMLYAVALHVSH